VLNPVPEYISFFHPDTAYSRLLLNVVTYCQNDNTYKETEIKEVNFLEI